MVFGLSNCLITLEAIQQQHFFYTAVTLFSHFHGSVTVATFINFLHNDNTKLLFEYIINKNFAIHFLDLIAMSYIIENLYMGSECDAYDGKYLKMKFGVNHLLTIDRFV